jgi:hypothetical protein
VGVGDEGVPYLEELSRREGREVPQVEKQRPLLEQEIDIERRIAERLVDQPRMEQGLQVRSTQ